MEYLGDALKYLPSYLQKLELTFANNKLGNYGESISDLGENIVK